MENLKVTQFHSELESKVNFPRYVRGKILLQWDKSRLLHHLRPIRICAPVSFSSALDHHFRFVKLPPLLLVKCEIKLVIRSNCCEGRIAAATLIFPPSVAHLGFDFTVNFLSAIVRVNLRDLYMVIWRR